MEAGLKPKLPTVFLGNERVQHARIVAGQRKACVERLQQQQPKRVLLVQDSTSFDFRQHPQTSGMGPLANAYTSGFWAHSTLMVRDDGVPLGLWEQQLWVRSGTGVARQRHERPFAEKESYRWVTGLPEIAACRTTQVITVCDREAHIYEFLEQAGARGADFIVRASRGRGFSLNHEELFACVADWPVQQHYTLDLPRRPERAARAAQVELRYGSLTLAAPQRATSAAASLTVQVVEVREPTPPAGSEALHWLLLTSCPVMTAAQAEQIVRWYRARWLIERFHYVLKSGCRVEERQLQTEARLERLLAVFNLVAWRLLWVAYQTRLTPDASCLEALTEDEWQALYAHHHRTTCLPQRPPTLQETTGWIAHLGGFLGRKSDGDPGVKVLWRGWQRLQDIVTTWRLFHPPPDVGNA